MSLTLSKFCLNHLDLAKKNLDYVKLFVFYNLTNDVSINLLKKCIQLSKKEQSIIRTENLDSRTWDPAPKTQDPKTWDPGTLNLFIELQNKSFKSTKSLTSKRDNTKYSFTYFSIIQIIGFFFSSKSLFLKFSGRFWVLLIFV